MLFVRRRNHAFSLMSMLGYVISWLGVVPKFTRHKCNTGTASQHVSQFGSTGKLLDPNTLEASFPKSSL